MNQLRDKHETREWLRISASALDRLVANGKLVPTKIGGRVFFREKTIEKFIRDAERAGMQRSRERAAALNSAHMKKPG